jgi:hypothetical protein
MRFPIIAAPFNKINGPDSEVLQQESKNIP